MHSLRSHVSISSHFLHQLPFIDMLHQLQVVLYQVCMCGCSQVKEQLLMQVTTGRAHEVLSTLIGKISFMLQRIICDRSHTSHNCHAQKAEAHRNNVGHISKLRVQKPIGLKEPFCFSVFFYEILSASSSLFYSLTQKRNNCFPANLTSSLKPTSWENT